MTFHKIQVYQTLLIVATCMLICTASYGKALPLANVTYEWQLVCVYMCVHVCAYAYMCMCVTITGTIFYGGADKGANFYLCIFHRLELEANCTYLFVAPRVVEII